jgi:hypothetical protein
MLKEVQVGLLWRKWNMQQVNSFPFHRKMYGYIGKDICSKCLSKPTIVKGISALASA